MNLTEFYLEINGHLMNDEKPSAFLEEAYHNPLFKEYPYDMLYILKSTNQSKKYHPEGSVWNHTMLVTDEAAKVKRKSKNQAVFMWAAFLHDIGKPSTTRQIKGKITSYNHEKAGAKLSADFLSQFTTDKNFINDVSQLIKYHMQLLFVVKNLPFADIKGMKQSTDIEEVALLSLCDRLGRTGCDKEKEERNVQLFLEKCRDG